MNTNSKSGGLQNTRFGDGSLNEVEQTELQTLRQLSDSCLLVSIRGFFFRLVPVMIEPER